MVNIVETSDYDALVAMFIRHELEFSEEDEVPTDLVKCWAANDGNELVGGAVLAIREGEYILDGISVEEEYRKEGLGNKLLKTVLDEVRMCGGRKLFLVARAPEFFRKNGFRALERDRAPNFFECFTCPQYQANCHPEVMVYELG